MRPIYKNKPNEKKKKTFFFFSKSVFYGIMLQIKSRVTIPPSCSLRWLTIIPCCTSPGCSGRWQMGCFATCSRFVLKQLILKQAVMFKTQQYVHVFLAACWNTTLKVVLLQALHFCAIWIVWLFPEETLNWTCSIGIQSLFIFSNTYVQQLNLYVGMFKE